MDELALAELKQAEADLQTAFDMMECSTREHLRAFGEYVSKYGLSFPVRGHYPEAEALRKAQKDHGEAMKKRDAAKEHIRRAKERLAAKAHAALPTVWERLDDDPF